MDKICWLASYPKSGNTWMRVFLANYLSDSDTPADINALDGPPIASDRACFDEWVGVKAAAFDADTVERLRPDVYRCLAREASKTVYMKAHDAWTLTSAREGLFPSDVTDGVVYIVRNPLDLVASCANHSGVDLQEAANRLCDPAYTAAQSHGGLSDQLRQRLGSWSGHVRSWLDDSRLRLHLVSYEEMLRDPDEAFGQVVRFCGLPFDGERLRKAIAFSDFRELQRQEKESDFRERSARSPGSFFRRGGAGGWREELPFAIIDQMTRTHSETMKRLGYADRDGQPL